MASADVQTFLQTMAQRKTMTESEMEDYLESIHKFTSKSKEDGMDMIASINRKIKSMNLEIRGVYMGEEKVFALINLASDEVAKKEATQLDSHELDVFKSILGAMAESAEHKLPMISAEDHRGTKMTRAAFYEFVDELCANRWLEKEEDDFLSYGPRTYIELSDNLRESNVSIPQLIHL